MTDGTQHDTWKAPSIYRMTEEAISRSEAKGTLTYGLDPVGNRQSLASTVTGINQQSASYNVNDQVLANTYDANGNTLGANGKSYAYDSMDRMTSFNNGSVKMVYLGDGNRVAKTVGGVTTQYLVDELNPTGLPQVMDEVVKSGAAQRTYLYGLRRISQTQVASGTTSYYGYDAHGDVRSLMNNGGVVTDTYDYDAFGNLVGSTGTTPNVYRYQGEAFDSETGLYYMRARYYDPTVGRFLNVDPMTDKGEHPYSYAAADPVDGHDPTGEQDVIEYTLLMWLYTAHVPPPHGYMSCQGGILFSGAGSGSGGGSGMQADASAGKTMARVEACQNGANGPGGPGTPGTKPGSRVSIRVKVIEDMEAHFTASEESKEQSMVAYAQQALANTDVDMQTTKVVGPVTLNESWEPSADRNSLNVIFSTATPYGKRYAGVSTPQGPPWISWTDIDEAHKHAVGVAAPWPGWPPVIWLGWTQTMVHEMVHILLRTGNETIVDSATLQISLGMELDNVKQGACGREFTITCQ